MCLLLPFSPIFSTRVWRHVPLLVAGAVLALRGRTITAVMRVLGLSDEPSRQTYHRVLNRAVGSSLQASRVLLGLLVAAFAAAGTVVVGIDETIERRRRPKTAACGIYRDPVRSSRSHCVKTRGLRWVCLMLLVPIPWTTRTWAVPFLTALTPAERYRKERGRHKTVTDWARQMLLVLHRWLPGRRLVMVDDEPCAAIPFLARCRHVAALVTRLRLDARLFAPARLRQPGQKERPRIVGPRLPSLRQRRDDPGALWTTLAVPHWYGSGDREVQIASETAVWYHGG